MKGKQSASFSWIGSGWLAVAFYVVCGVILLLWPELMLGVVNYLLATVLCVSGILSVIGYFKSSALQGAMGYRLALGLGVLTLGVVMFFNPTLLAGILPFVGGISMVAGGFGKIQMAFDLKRIGEPRWWMVSVGALISFFLGILAIANPTFVFTVASQFIGLAMLVEALLDAVSILAVRRKLKQIYPEDMKNF